LEEVEREESAGRKEGIPTQLPSPSPHSARQSQWRGGMGSLVDEEREWAVVNNVVLWLPS